MKLLPKPNEVYNFTPTHIHIKELQARNNEGMIVSAWLRASKLEPDCSGVTPGSGNFFVTLGKLPNSLCHKPSQKKWE